jgi:hypothetical protein
MWSRRTVIVLLVTHSLALSGNIHAALLDRGGGLIYDQDRNITWLADAKYAATELTDARRDTIIAAVPVVAGHTLTASDFVKSGSSYTGAMSWWGATAWANQLVYGGFADWRLPAALNQDGSGPCTGNNCSGSELGHLFYSELGGIAGNSLLSGTDPDLPKFSNITDDVWWFGTEDSLFSFNAWTFRMFDGSQLSGNKGAGPIYAWAVRSGDVAAISEPPSYALAMAALVLLGWSRRRPD